jgi:enolase-phosphatase E1
VIELTARCVLLDIEGTISDIRFVYDVMFPYARREIPNYLDQHWRSEPVLESINLIARDAGFESAADWLSPNWQTGEPAIKHKVCHHIDQLMSSDSKTTGLKDLQGLVWKSGFERHEIRAELFDDVVPSLENWKKIGLDLRIYSSGSVLAQRMFFEHTTLGNIGNLFTAHYDTTIGSKRESQSYNRIAEDCAYRPEEIVFLTDVHAEMVAANSIGMKTIVCVRPNNAPLPADFTGLTTTTFSDLNISLATALA